MLRRLWTKVVHTWESWQVELHGEYSVERLHNLKSYSLRTSLARTLFVIFVTPLPCLLCVILADLIPLEAPERGLAHSHTFWLRAFLITWSINITVMEQCRHFIPALRMAISQNVLVALLASAGATALAFGYSCAIGYPLPFTITLGSPGCCALLLTLSAWVWGKRVRESPAIQSDLLNYVLVVVVQVAMTYTYPAYNFVFIGLTASSQTAFTLLLPVMKIIAKNCLGYCFRNMEDFKPEVVIFNVEIFHALFVSYCTQRSNSINTTILLMAMDFVHACLSLHDVDVILKSLHRLLRHDGSDDSSARGQEQPVTTATQVPAVLVGSVHRDLDLLTAAIFLLSIDEKLQASPSLRYHSQVRTSSQRAVLPEQQQQQNTNRKKSTSSKVDSKSVPATTGSFQPQRDNFTAMTPEATQAENRPATATAPASQSHPDSPTASVILDAISTQAATHLSDAQKQMLQTMSPENRLLFVHQTLQLLHLTEFLLLVEFTEVIIPAIYCAYLGVISHLPNRQYYVSLRNLDDAALWRNITNVTVYASLEVLSFLLLSVLLYRKLRISPLKQLSFVLDTQWQLVQSKLILWVVFIVQTSLEHFGVDYSFKFAWLH